MSDNFMPDISIKKLLTEISTKELIKIINGIFGTYYSLDTNILFDNTEHFSILGTLDKSSVRGDLIVKLDNLKNNDSDTIVLELQSTTDSTMGFRMFVYSLNASKLEELEDKKDIYIFPKGVTIYTVTGSTPKRGVDEVHMKIENFRVGDTKYSAENGDLLTVEFPFINILAMDFKEFKNSDLELLKIIYPYRYKKNENLLDDITKLQGIIDELLAYINEFNNNDQIIVKELLNDLFIDIHQKAQENNKTKAVEVMATATKTISQKIREESFSNGFLDGEKNKSIKIAKNLLLKGVPIDTISECTGLSIKDISQFQQEL